MFNNILTCSKVINLATVKARWEVSGEGAITGSSYNPLHLHRKTKEANIIQLGGWGRGRGGWRCSPWRRASSLAGLVSGFAEAPMGLKPLRWGVRRLHQTGPGCVRKNCGLDPNAAWRRHCCCCEIELLRWVPEQWEANKKWRRRNNSLAFQSLSSSFFWWRVTGRQRGDSGETAGNMEM